MIEQRWLGAKAHLLGWFDRAEDAFHWRFIYARADTWYTNLFYDLCARWSYARITQPPRRCDDCRRWVEKRDLCHVKRLPPHDYRNPSWKVYMWTCQGCAVGEGKEIDFDPRRRHP
jgi:hypothetical protein